MNCILPTFRQNIARINILASPPTNFVEGAVRWLLLSAPVQGYEEVSRRFWKPGELLTVAMQSTTFHYRYRHRSRLSRQRLVRTIEVTLPAL